MTPGDAAPAPPRLKMYRAVFVTGQYAGSLKAGPPLTRALYGGLVARLRVSVEVFLAAERADDALAEARVVHEAIGFVGAPTALELVAFDNVDVITAGQGAHLAAVVVEAVRHETAARIERYQEMRAGERPAAEEADELPPPAPRPASDDKPI